MTHQRLARAFQAAATRVIGYDEFPGSVALKLIASVHFCAIWIADLTRFDGNSIGGSSRLRVVTTDLTFVHYLSLDWLDCPGLLMSGGARDRFSELNRAQNKRAAIAGQSNSQCPYLGWLIPKCGHLPQPQDFRPSAHLQISPTIGRRRTQGTPFEYKTLAKKAFYTSKKPRRNLCEANFSRSHC
jgi:hypothetical protein